jgi:hypothetical protein
LRLRPLRPTLTLVDLLVWSAARRLTLLVAGSLAIVLLVFARGAHVGALAAITGAVALALLGSSLVPLVRARRILHEGSPPTPGTGVYRASARAPDRDPQERAAVRHAALALMLVAVAGALTVVAAASR